MCFVTLGCAKNEVDSREMADRLAAAGIAVVPEPEDADCIVVNTCSFIQAATEESLAAIFEMADLDTVKCGQAKLVVAGCMPARYGSDLEGELKEACAFVPCSREDDIVEIVRGLFPDRGAGEAMEPTAGEPSVYVKISDGCDRFCSFCTIPYIRGRYHSFSYETVHDSVASAVALGAREIVLIAQDTGRWGQDFEPAESLASLVDRLAQSFPDTWLRIMYVQPEGVTSELLEAMAAHENVCPYIDVPLQHCNPSLLERMNRTGSAKEYLDLVARIRDTVPGATVRTTLIAGFPGETDEQFDELCDFVEEAEFDYVGVFPYSREEGTRAAGFDDQVDDDVKLERAQVLRDLADGISHMRVSRRIGEKLDVLVLGCEEDGQLYGRCMCQAPEVDGVTYLAFGEPGEIRSVTIADTLLYEMEGE